MDFRDNCVDWDPVLLKRVTVPEGDRAVGGRVTVNCNAIGGADFILPSVTATDGTLLVVD